MTAVIAVISFSIGLYVGFFMGRNSAYEYVSRKRKDE